MARPSPTALLAELGRLADDPVAQARFAAALLATERRAQLIGPALAALEQLPIPEARPALLQLYADLDADGTRHDAGGSFRAAALRALRPWATTADLPLLERAVTTYEYLPPGRSEEAAPIRAAGLVALADLDPELARFHAARLLVDPSTSRLSGEPGKTAAGVLAAQSQQLVLYLSTLREGQHDDVSAECLRHLADAPDSIAHTLCARFGPEASEAVQLGLIDMLLARPDRPHFRDELRARLRTPGPLTVFRYLAVVMAASRRRELVAEVIAAVEAERDPHGEPLYLVVDLDIAQGALLAWFRAQGEVHEFFTTLPDEYPNLVDTYPLELVERRVFHHRTGLDVLFSGQGVRDQLDISIPCLEGLIDAIALLDYDVICYGMPGEWKVRPVIVSLLARHTTSPFVVCPPGRKERDGAYAALEVLSKIEREDGRSALDAAMVCFIEGERGHVMHIRSVRQELLRQYPMVTDLGALPRDPALLSMAAERREFCSVFDLAPRRPYCHAIRTAVRRWVEAVDMPPTWLTRPDGHERRPRRPFWPALGGSPRKPVGYRQCVSPAHPYRLFVAT